MFNDSFARHAANRYRKHGLSKPAGTIVELAEERGVEGATVLEIGGGVGDIQLELLKRGAVRTTNLELSPAYDDEARRLLHEHGLSNRAERRIVDIAATPDDVEPADIVVLHRVVCCYPDYEALLGAVADHARRMVVFSHPPRNAATLTLARMQNAFWRLRGREFRFFAHPPEAMTQVLVAHGMRAGARRRGPIWQIMTAVR